MAKRKTGKQPATEAGDEPVPRRQYSEAQLRGQTTHYFTRVRDGRVAKSTAKDVQEATEALKV